MRRRISSGVSVVRRDRFVAKERGLCEGLDKNYFLSCTRFRRHRVRCFMEQEVRHGEKAVYAGVQA